MWRFLLKTSSQGELGSENAMDDAEWEEMIKKFPARDPNNPDFTPLGVRLNTEGCTYR